MNLIRAVFGSAKSKTVGIIALQRKPVQDVVLAAAAVCYRPVSVPGNCTLNARTNAE
jgi:hypothetical protein